MACLVEFKLSALASLGSLFQYSRNLLRAQWLKAARRIQRLLQDLYRIASGDYYASGKAHGIVQALDGAHCLALENERVAHGLHAQHADVLLHQNRKHLGFEAAEMVVHHIERHLHSVKVEIMARSSG